MMEWMKHVELLMTVVAGSRSRGMGVTHADVDKGLADKVSDHDLRSVFFMPHRYDWLLNERMPEQMTGQTYKELEPMEHDMFHLRRFMQLVYKPSPEHVELLWSPVYNQMCSFNGDMLRAARHKFSSKALAKRYVAAAGYVESKVVSDNMGKTDLELEQAVGRSHLLGRAVHYRASDPVESRKALADVLRRLYVAQQMLLGTAWYETVDLENQSSLQYLPSWIKAASKVGVELPENAYLVYTEKDGMLKLLPDERMLLYLRNVRFGLVKWEDALDFRNNLFDNVELLLQTSTLRDKADEGWGEVFLQYMAMTIFV